MLIISQDKCPIEEKAIIRRRLDWLTPPSPPITALTRIKKEFVNWVIISPRRGPIFWKVIKRAKIFHDIDLEILTNHIWNGAAPILINRARGIKNENDWFNVLAKKITEATDWIKKYFSLFSFLSSIIMGTNLREFISILIHKPNQEWADIIRI